MTVEHVSTRPFDARVFCPKLVVWDIDGTLWHGVIDDERDGPLRRGIELIPQLTSRGIVNTICSNNSSARARGFLEKWGVLDHTVFEQIVWEDKPTMLARILAFFAVSPAHTLVVDDDARVRANLESALGVVVISPDELDEADLTEWGNAATGSRRLEHYRVLERRHAAELAHPTRPGDPHARVAFLHDCEIRVVTVDVLAHAERIAELSRRSNRLNLTHSRLEADDIRALVTDKDHICSAIVVRDRFGDYGLCGFVAFDVERAQLSHFYWSCRVLNQGVVEYVVDELRRHHDHSLHHPALVDFGCEVDWVGGDRPFAVPAPEPLLHDHRDTTDVAGARRVRLVGGCDLDIVAALWDNHNDLVEVSGLSDHNGIQQYAHSSVPLLLARAQRDLSRFGAAQLPWLGTIEDPHTWNSYDMVVLSLWVDYSCMTLRHRNDPDDVVAPTFATLGPASSEWEWQHWMGNEMSREKYAEEFVPGPPLTDTDLATHIRTLCRMMPNDVHLVLLGAPEIDRGQTYSWGEDQFTRNRALNAAVAEATADFDTVTFFDMTQVVNNADDLAAPDEPTGFHYRRDAYARLTGELNALIDPNRPR